MGSENFELKELNDKLKLTKEITHVIVEESDLQSLIDRICSVFCNFFNNKSAWITLFNKSNEFEYFASEGLGDIANKLRQDFKRVPSALKKVLKSDSHIIIEPTDENYPIVYFDTKLPLFIKPLVANKESIGLFVVGIEESIKNNSSILSFYDGLINDVSASISKLFFADDIKIMLNNTPDGIVVLDKNLNILDVNPAFCELAGVEKSKIVGVQGLFLAKKLLKGNSIRTVLRAAKQLLSGKERKPFEVEFQGKTVLVTTDFQKLKQSRIAIVRDISNINEAKQKLIASEGRLKTLSDASFESIFVSEKGICVDQNMTAERMFGYSHKEAIGKPGTDWIVPEDRKIVLHNMMNNYLDPYEVIALRKDGSSFPCEIQAKTLDVNRKKYRVTALRDITIRKQSLSALQESRNHLKIAVDGGKLGTWEWDLKTGEINTNDFWAEFKGYKLHEIENNINWWRKLVHPEDLPKFDKSLQNHLNGNTLMYEAEFRVKHKNGNWLWIQDRGRVFEWDEKGKPRKISGIHVDISELKEIQEKLNDNNKLLTEAKEKAEDSDRLKTAFLATMNHELRTPLNSIIGFSDLMPDMTDDEEIIDFSEKILKNGSHLLNLIEDIFDIATAEQTDIVVRNDEFYIRDLFQELKNELQISLNQSGKAELIKLSFEVRDSLMSKKVISDKPKILQLVNNLIKNAVKFTHEGEICLGIKIKAPSDLEIFVKDTGIGIADDTIDIIFNFFRQGDYAHTRKYDGLGIGLAISKKIADALEGKISVKTDLDKGSVFTATIPVEFTTFKSKQVSDINKPNKIVNLEGKTIMTVEDDDFSLQLIEVLLKPLNCRLIKVLDGIQALEAYKNEIDIHLILMDLRMPNMDGFQATKEIRKMSETIPIIALTAHAFALEKDKAIKAGCNDIITKPVRKEILYEKLKQYLFD